MHEGTSPMKSPAKDLTPSKSVRSDKDVSRIKELEQIISNKDREIADLNRKIQNLERENKRLIPKKSI